MTLSFSIQTALLYHSVKVSSLLRHKTPESRMFYALVVMHSHDYLLLAKLKLENLHCEKQCNQSICRISTPQNYFFTLVSCVPEAFCEYKVTP